MSISPETLAAIQSAGQAIDAARQALVADTQDHARRVTEAVLANPFGLENDKLFHHWKTVARMAQTVQDMEQQFRDMFHAAADMALDDGTGLPLAAPVQVATVVDATDVEPHAPRQRKARAQAPAPRKGRKPAPGSTRRAGGKPGRKSGSSAAADGLPGGNPGKVLAELRKLIDRRGFTAVNQSTLSRAAGVPNGSITAALRRLKELGLLAEGERGQYRLL